MSSGCPHQVTLMHLCLLLHVAYILLCANMHKHTITCELSISDSYVTFKICVQLFLLSSELFLATLLLHSK